MPEQREGERGFILLVGVVMGGLLALGVWKLFHVVGALSEREALTNAADAIALDNATWHAQGMNLLVWMNIGMAVLLSIIVALRALELLLIAIAVVAAIFFPGAVGAIGNGLSRVVQMERRVGPRILRIMHMINMGERVVAAVVPAIPGAVNRVELAGRVVNPDARSDIDIGSVEDYYESAGVIDQGVPISLASIPTNVDRRIPGFPVRMGQLDGQVHSGRVARTAELLVGNPSLPVEEEDYYQVCSRAAEFMVAGFTGMIARTGLISESVARLVAGRVGQVAGSLPALACEPFDANSIRDEIEQNVGAACDQERDRQENDPDPDRRGNWTRSDQRNCERRNRERAQEAYRQPSSGTSPDDIKTAKLWNVANHKTNVFLHTWAAAVGPAERFPAEGTIRGWIMFLQGRQESQSKVALGEAEFFFVCHRTNRTCNEDAMWRPWWRAETIKLQAPWKEIDVAGLVLGWGNNAAGNLLSAALRRVMFSGFRAPPGALQPQQAATGVTMFLFGRGSGSNILTRYLLPGMAQNRVQQYGGELMARYRPFVEDLLIH